MMRRLSSRWMRALGGLLLPCLAASCASSGGTLAKRTSRSRGWPWNPGMPARPSTAIVSPWKRTRGTGRSRPITSGRSRRSNGRRTKPSAGRSSRAPATPIASSSTAMTASETMRPSWSFGKAALEEALRACRFGLADAQALKALRGGNLPKALRLRQDALKESPKDAVLGGQSTGRRSSPSRPSRTRPLSKGLRAGRAANATPAPELRVHRRPPAAGGLHEERPIRRRFGLPGEP